MGNRYYPNRKLYHLRANRNVSLPYVKAARKVWLVALSLGSMNGDPFKRRRLFFRTVIELSQMMKLEW